MLGVGAGISPLPHTCRPSSVTNGGKTTLTNSLLKVLPNCCVIHQDDFFKVADWGAGVWGIWGTAFSLALLCPGDQSPTPGNPVRLRGMLASLWHVGMLLSMTSYTSAFPLCAMGSKGGVTGDGGTTVPCFGDTLEQRGGLGWRRSEPRHWGPVFQPQDQIAVGEDGFKQWDGKSIAPALAASLLPVGAGPALSPAVCPTSP